MREREIVAEFHNNTIYPGTYTYTYSFTQNQNNKKPPSVSLIQDIKGYGVLDLRCSYKISVSLYETVSRVDKIIKRGFPILIQE